MRQHSAYAGNCCHRATKYKTVHRRFPRWCGQQVLQQVHTDLASALREEGVIDEREAFIDASFASANGGKIGPTRRGKGVKILAIVDRADLPLPVSTHAANHHDATLVQLSFDLYMLEAKPEHVMSDKAYDSDKRNEQLLGQGVKRRFAWMQRKRRLLVRCEYYPANFLGVVQLASLTILLKRS